MPTTGYSGTPLLRKLGIKSGQRICLSNAPRGYPSYLGKLPDGCRRVRKLEPDLDLIQAFFRSESELAVRLPDLKDNLDINGALWLCWPKKSSGVDTDLSDSVVRRLGLANGLVDVKVCAVDDVWSGLKFCYRLADRKTR